MSDGLFRQEVIKSQKKQWAGHIILTRPFSFVFLTWCAACTAACIIVFLCVGSYTSKTTAEGQLMAVSGVVRVYSPDTGTITQKFAEEGVLVKQGDPLFVLSTSRFSSNGSIQDKLAAEAQIKKTLVFQDLERLKRIHQNEIRNLKNTISRLHSQHNHITQQQASQIRRIRLAEQLLAKYKLLVLQDAAAEQEVMAYESDLLDQRARLEVLKREETETLKEIEQQNSVFNSLPERHKTELSQLNRAIADMNQEILDLGSKSEQTIRAAKTGYVSAVNVENGQQVDSSKLLLSITPEQTELFANLYVPSKAIGFVKIKDKVILRYQAYPYQKFGHAEGEIVSVARTALGKQELAGLGTIFSEMALPNEPVYLVKVKLTKQTVKVYGEERPLQIGMILEADILHERKKLYEWVLDPLYSISGKLN